MKDNQTQNLQAEAEAAEAENTEDIAAMTLGKFKDVRALAEAYKALEAEFTRRSQKLKELEASKEQEAPAQSASAEDPSRQATDFTLSDDVKNSVILEYLNAVRANRGVPLVTGGGAVPVARNKPVTLSQAGKLAKNFFDSKED